MNWNDEQAHGERVQRTWSVDDRLDGPDVVAFLRAEAARFRARDEGADAAVAAHVEILADRIARGEHEGASQMPSPEGEK